LSWLNLRHGVPGLVGGNVWYLDMPHETFTFDPDDAEQTRVVECQLELYARAADRLRQVAPLAVEGAPDGEPFEMLGWTVRYAMARLRALMIQLEAQQGLRERLPVWRDAAERGLAFDDELQWPSRDYFDQWLESSVARRVLSEI